jgi:Tfp pilus assembly protein PilX
MAKWFKPGLSRRLTRLLPSVKKQGGYVLPWVLIMALVASLIMVPFLSFMLNGVRTSYSYADTMAEYYAADSGIEDAIHKLKYEYSATTTLTSDISSGDSTIDVDSTSIFPDAGIIQIESELIHYTAKTDTEFNGCSRGYGGTSARSHDNATELTASLPDNTVVGDSWEYAIEDINGKNVNINIETIWILENLESDEHGTQPHEELVVVGQMLDKTGTMLSANIDDGDHEIPVFSTTSFPAATAEYPSIIRIENELIQYTGKEGSPDPRFTGCTRGVNNTVAADHVQEKPVTSEQVTYHIDITYDNSAGLLLIDRVASWLPEGFNYVPGTNNITTQLTGPIFNTAVSIPVDSTELFPDSGVICIEHEQIYYDRKDADTFKDCIRGYNGTTAADHLTADTLVFSEPVQAPFRGGTTVIWEFENVNFEDMPREVPAGGGSQPRDEFPVRRTVTFGFTPARQPKGIFSWSRTNRHDMYLSWDTSGGSFKITSTATDPETGTATAVESYVSGSKIVGRSNQIFGDARAIGNSILRGDPVNRDVLVNESSATIGSSQGNAIPEGATVEAAYLYWSGWKRTPWNASDYSTEDLAPNVNQATFNGVAITADRVQTLPNVTGSHSPHGWSFSCFKNVTSFLQPEQSATITLNPSSFTDSATITNRYQMSDADLLIRADGANPGNITVTVGSNTYTIAPSGYRTISINNYLDTATLTSGGVTGLYLATIEATNGSDIASVDGGGVNNYWIYGPNRAGPHSVNVSLNTTESYPEATVTGITSSARANITAAAGNPGDITIADEGIVLEPGESANDLWYTSADPADLLSGATLDPYEITVTCTDGMIKIEYGSSSLVLGEPGSQMTNGDYTFGLDLANPFITSDDIGDEYSYAGWSLLIIYSHPDEPAHQLFLYDDLTYVASNANNFPDGYLEFAIGGFLAPEDFEGLMTLFVGEGDPHYVGDYIELNGYRLPRPGDPYDDPTGLNPQDNVWNGQSSVAGAGSGAGQGVDIDSFFIESPVIEEGDTTAVLTLDSGVDIWNIVYVFVSFITEPSDETPGTPLAIISYNSSS